MMLETTNPHAIPRQIAQAVATTFNADIVAVAAVNDAHWADVIAAYNFLYERDVPALGVQHDAGDLVAQHRVRLFVDLVPIIVVVDDGV